MMTDNFISGLVLQTLLQFLCGKESVGGEEILMEKMLSVFSDRHMEVCSTSIASEFKFVNLLGVSYSYQCWIEVRGVSAEPNHHLFFFCPFFVIIRL